MKTILTLINLFLLTACIFFCAEIVYKTMLKDTASSGPEINSSSENSIISAEKQTKKNVNPQDLEIIAQRNLFKVDIEKQGASDKASRGKTLEKLDPTTLSLTLWGTVIGGSGLYAVIEDKKSGIQALYQEGDSIQEATIKKILKKEVILGFQGKDQILEMETNAENTGLVKRAVNTSAAGAAVNENPQPVILHPPPVQPGNTGEAASAAAKIKFRPFFTKGSPDGVMVYGIKPESVFSRAGIRNGDIVKSVNGTPVSSVEDASALMSGLENSGAAKLTLIRSGETKEISYSAGSSGQPEGKPLPVAPEGIKGEKLPDPAQDKGGGGTQAQAPGEQEPEKTENSEDQNKGEE